MLCPACGSEENGKFCGKCGTALTDRLKTETSPEEPSSAQDGERDEVTARETDAQQVNGAADGEAAAVETNDLETANADAKAELSFWNAGTLIYLTAGVALFGYTCIYYWN